MYENTLISYASCEVLLVAIFLPKNLWCYLMLLIAEEKQSVLFGFCFFEKLLLFIFFSFNILKFLALRQFLASPFQ